MGDSLKVRILKFSDNTPGALDRHYLVPKESPFRELLAVLMRLGTEGRLQMKVADFELVVFPMISSLKMSRV